MHMRFLCLFSVFAVDVDFVLQVNNVYTDSICVVERILRWSLLNKNQTAPFPPPPFPSLPFPSGRIVHTFEKHTHVPAPEQIDNPVANLIITRALPKPHM